MKIIAECGVNYKDLKEAKEMIRRCKDLGLFAAKFQLFDLHTIDKSPIKDQLIPKILTKEDAKELFEYGKEIRQEVFFTPTEPYFIKGLEKIGVNYYKVRYKDRNNKEIIDRIKLTKKQYFISMNLEDNPYFGYGYEQRKVLFCQPYYPCGIGDYVFFSSIIFNGISDHTKDLQLLKIALDTFNINPFEYFEKHVKLNDDCIESDWSVTFEQLKEVLK